MSQETTLQEVNRYQYRGAGAMVRLHERHLRVFVATWLEAKVINVRLPETHDPNYESLETLLRHVLAAARSYMTWMCEQLALTDPNITEAPSTETIERDLDAYIEHLFERWQLPLKDVPEAVFGNVYTSRWGVAYSIDAMLEHAVMHPIRHEFQLRNLIDEHRSLSKG
jgi:hypothetical protein